MSCGLAQQPDLRAGLEEESKEVRGELEVEESWRDGSREGPREGQDSQRDRRWLLCQVI